MHLVGAKDEYARDPEGMEREKAILKQISLMRGLYNELTG